MIILLVSKYFNDGHFLSRNIDTNFWTCVQAQSFLLNIFLLLSYTLHYPLLHRRTYSYICRSIHSPNQPHIESLTPSHFLPFTAWHAHSITRPLNYSPSHSLTHSVTQSLAHSLIHLVTLSHSLIDLSFQSLPHLLSPLSYLLQWGTSRLFDTNSSRF